MANFDLGFDFGDSDDNEGKNETQGRFGNSTKVQQDNLLDEKDRKATQKATKTMIKILTDYLAEKKLKPLDQVEDDELPDILFDLYTNLKKAKGGEYKLQTLKCIRAGINRHMKMHRNLDIINDIRFTRTNQMFQAVATKARKEGRGSTRSTPPIEPEDLPALAEYFTHDFMAQPDPRLLQKSVLFNIIYFFCRRGRQNIYDFTQDMFEIAVDPDGREYVFQAIDEMDKNHGIDTDRAANEGRMYAQEDSILCPVALFRLYKSKLNPDMKYFWQRPKQGKINYIDNRWYDRVRVGHGPIENFMAKLSIDAKLSKRYTNHSIRSTVMGILGDEFEGRHVIGLSGHKSESTIKQYARKLSAAKKREMSESLATNMIPKKPKIGNNYHFKNIKPAETVPKPPEDMPLPLQPAPMQPIQQMNPQDNVQFMVEELNDAPPDDMLLKFLASLEDPNPEQENKIPEAQGNLVPAPINNTMNIQNVQNVNPNPIGKQLLPAMYFPNSNVTINYNFNNK